MKKRALDDSCGPHDSPSYAPVDETTLERTSELFRAVGDAGRLRLLHRLMTSEACVSELAEELGTKLSTLSQQLKHLHLVHAVARRREGKHVWYRLADQHVAEIVNAALEHGSEPKEKKKKRRS